MNVMLDLLFELLISLLVGSGAAMGCAVFWGGYNVATGVANCPAAIDVDDWKGVFRLPILVVWAMD